MVNFMFMDFLRKIGRPFVLLVQRFGAIKVGIGGALVIAAVLLGVHFATRSSPAAQAPAEVSHVQVETVANLSQQTGPLVVTGKVTSLNQATILAQTGGQITTLSKKVGDYVSAGQIIAEFENSSQQAAVAQAQGALDAANANLAKVSGPTGTSAKAAAVNALLAAYGSVDSAIRGTADTMISNPDSTNPQFLVTTSNSQLPITIVNERETLGQAWARETARAKTLSQSDDLNAELTTTLGEVRDTRTFFDNILQALNTAIPNQNVSQAQLTADISAATAARTSLTSALSALTSAQATLVSGGSGSASPDVASAQAQVAQEQAALASAEANLEKTIARSPISGAIVSLPVHQGDYVSAFGQVAQVSNPGALEIDIGVTPSDAKTLTVGSKAIINGSTQGIVVSIAPALDPSTGAIPVKVGLSAGQDGLTDGDTVSVSLSRAAAPPKTAGAMLIPIIAAKITPQGPAVFTVSASSTLVIHPITLGTILGDQVTVLAGLTQDMQIVTDARGLSDGQTVAVNPQ
ncbi:MAG: efflux RND transporter periplasmic adaptor subunit [Patescibacteria group bacterium]|nr:efflux RND transporter periplasmic adaptor subunit [Patescibacteria group bacterium]